MSYEGPGLYEHYKGGRYEVLGIAMEEATLTPVVVYRPLSEGPRFAAMEEAGATMWTRPVENFNENVRLPGTNPEVEVARFIFVRDLLP